MNEPIGAMQSGSERSGAVGRLLEVRTCTPAENMAVDQALLESTDAGGPPTLRFYCWSEPTLSLGYFQALGDRDLHPASRGLAIVRRSTGGGAIVHHRELTYSLTLPLDRHAIGARADVYQGVHAAIAEALRALGFEVAAYRGTGGRLGSADAFLCFQRRTDEDLLFRGYKMLGSAQRRGKRSLLQHGSLLLTASEYAPELPGLLNLGPAQIGYAELLDRVVNAAAPGIGSKLRIRWNVGELSKLERHRAAQFQQQRFSSCGWLSRR